jgi:hypothetical protein
VTKCVPSVEGRHLLDDVRPRARGRGRRRARAPGRIALLRAGGDRRRIPSRTLVLIRSAISGDSRIFGAPVGIFTRPSGCRTPWVGGISSRSMPSTSRQR